MRHDNAVAYVMSEPWAARPSALAAIRAFAAGLELTPDMVRALHSSEAPSMVAAVDGPVIEGTRRATMRDGVAVIPVTGPICRYGGLFASISGSTSVKLIGTDLAAVRANPDVKAILLDLNTPGGTVDGIGELAGMVREAAGSKPVVGYVGNQASSAGYYVASACSSIVIAPMGLVGSIGVIATYDTSESPDSTTIISTQSPHKRVDPRKESGRAMIQDQVDAMARIFIEDVAKYRGVPVKTVLAEFGKGAELMGAEAVRRGMADSVGSYESTIAQLSRGKPPGKSTPKRPAGRASGKPTTKGANAMTFKERIQLMTALFGGGQADADAEEAGPEAVENTRPIVLQAVRGFAPAPNGAKTVLTEADIEARIEAKVKERYEAQALERRRQVAAEEARSFLAAQVREGKVKPAESSHVAAMYIDAYMADNSGLVKFEADGSESTASRLSFLKAGIEARTPSPAVKAVLGSGPDAAAKLIPEGFQALPNESDPEAEAKATSKATVDGMLAAAGILS